MHKRLLLILIGIALCFSANAQGPAGNGGELQFNNDGNFGADSRLTFNTFDGHFRVDTLGDLNFGSLKVVRWISCNSVRTFGQLTRIT